MRIRGPLPSRLGGRFTIQEAARAGVGRTRRDAPDLLRPFPGIRSVTPVDTFSERVSTYHRRMKPAHRYVGRTAMRLWGLPLPWEWNRRESLQVAVPPDAAPARTAGVMGRRLAPHRAETLILQGVPVVDAIAAFFSTAAELDLGHAIAVADALLTTADDYPGLLMKGGERRVSARLVDVFLPNRHETRARCRTRARTHGCPGPCGPGHPCL